MENKKIKGQEIKPETVASLKQKNMRLQNKCLSQENKILKQETKILKLEQKLLKLQTENLALKTPGNISVILKGLDNEHNEIDLLKKK